MGSGAAGSTQAGSKQTHKIIEQQKRFRVDGLKFCRMPAIIFVARFLSSDRYPLDKGRREIFEKKWPEW